MKHLNIQKQSPFNSNTVLNCILRIFPERTSIFFLLSSLFAILCLGFFSLERFRSFSYNPLAASHKLIFNIFDPIFFHLLSLGLFSFIVYKTFSPAIQNKCIRVIISSLIPAAFLIFGFIFTTFILKPAFGFNEGTEIDPAAFPPIFTSTIKSLLNPDYYLLERNNPSGYIFRQVHMLFFGILLTFYQPRNLQSKNDVSLSVKLSLLGIAFSTTAIMWMQLYFGLQSYFTIILSISTAITIFWIVFYLLGLIFGGRTSELTTSIVALTAITFPLFFYFSNDAHYWFYISIGFIFIMGIAHFFWGHYNHNPIQVNQTDKFDPTIN